MKSSGINTAIAALVITTIVTVAVLVTGCDDPKYVAPPYYKYKINVAGLADFSTGDSNATLMVPLPAYDGVPVLWVSNISADVMDGNGSIDLNNWANNWKYHGTHSLKVVDSPYGKMLAIGFNETDYSVRMVPNYTSSWPMDMVQTNKLVPSFDDIHLYIGYNAYEGRKNATFSLIGLLGDSPLSPVSNATGLYTRWPYGEGIENYTSYVYMDPALQPLRNNSRIILDIQLEIVIGEHPWGANPGDHCMFIINESIPGGVTGYIPVTVQHAGTFHQYMNN